MKNWFKESDPYNNMLDRTIWIILAFIILPVSPVILTLLIIWLLVKL
jgi:hypothetical protein